MVESFYNESALFQPNVFMICILSDVLQPKRELLKLSHSHLAAGEASNPPCYSDPRKLVETFLWSLCCPNTYDTAMHEEVKF